MASVAKRYSRSESSDALLRLEGVKREFKRQELDAPGATAPLLALQAGESKAAFFRRLSSRLRRHLFSPATDFERDGLYLYKRPVRSEDGSKAALLASGGSVFHHVVVYVKQGGQLTALEFGPANNMDITGNMMAATPTAPVVKVPAPAPEPECLPMLHIAAPCHALGDKHVQQALAFAEGQPYHALQQNCIAFADYMVRVLTGGAVRSAPLIFDCLVGKVPEVDSPLLGLLALTTQLSWHDVTHGGRLLAALLQQHPGALLPPPGARPEALHLLEEAPEPESCTEAAAPGPSAAAAPAPAPAGAAGNPLAALLAANGLGPLTALLPALAQPRAATAQAQQPADSSGSEDTHGSDVMAGGVARAASASAASLAAASVASSFASTGSSRLAKRPQLPARKRRDVPARGST